MNLKGTGDIFRLLLKLLYYFVIDRNHFKKLILHSGREFWYLLTIIFLSILIASLVGQLAVTKLEDPLDKPCPSYEEFKNLLLEDSELINPEIKIEFHCKPEDPDIPLPNNPVIAPIPKTPERKKHDIDILLDDIR